jgi:hypothetical protein
MRNCEAVPDHLPGNPRQRLACRRKPGRNPAQRRSRTGCSSSGSGGWNGSASSYRGCKPVTPEGQATGDHEPPGFANAGRWRLVTAGGRQPEAWRASWTVADRNAAKNRIWAVHYEGEPAGEVIPQRPDLRAEGEQLRKSLRFAREFAASHGLDTWVAWFDRALASSSDIPTTRTCCLPPIRRSRATLHQLRRKRGSSAAWDRGTTSGSLMALSRASTGSFRGPSTPPPCKRSRPAQTRVSARLTIGETAVQPAVR